MYALVVVGSVWQALSLLRAHYSPIGARSNHYIPSKPIYKNHIFVFVLHCRLGITSTENKELNLTQIVPWQSTPLPNWIYTVEYR